MTDSETFSGETGYKTEFVDIGIIFRPKIRIPFYPRFEGEPFEKNILSQIPV